MWYFQRLMRARCVLPPSHNLSTLTHSLKMHSQQIFCHTPADHIPNSALYCPARAARPTLHCHRPINKPSRAGSCGCSARGPNGALTTAKAARVGEAVSSVQHSQQPNSSQQPHNQHHHHHLLQGQALVAAGALACSLISLQVRGACAVAW